MEITMNKHTLNYYMVLTIVFVEIFFIFEFNIEIPTIYSNYIPDPIKRDSISNLLISLSICLILLGLYETINRRR